MDDDQVEIVKSNMSRQRSQRIAAEAERWAPILRGLSPYEAATRIIEDAQSVPSFGERERWRLAGALLAVAGDGWQPIETAPHHGNYVRVWEQEGVLYCPPGQSPTHWLRLPAPPDSDKSP